MNFFEIWPYVAVFPFVSSVAFFFLAKDKNLMQRSFASIHGWAGLSILPFAVLITSQYPGLRAGVGLPGILILGGVSATSVFYSIATVKGRWIYHLFHIPTVLTVAMGFVASLFVLADHH